MCIRFYLIEYYLNYDHIVNHNLIYTEMIEKEFKHCIKHHYVWSNYKKAGVWLKKVQYPLYTI